MALTQKPAAILPVMVGTAGHVDHGKSALVTLLTGCEMDRQPEARARGLTIDLGFAPCRLPGNRLVGIIDVPGHEDFIRNMVAGAASIDVLMLVVAADDGVMPQTREHLQIVRLLRTARVMVVVTKIDLVDAEMRELVEEDIRGFLAENGFSDVPVVLASNTTFEGINNVRRTLLALVDEVRREPDQRAFRMYVERVFSVKGYGTVVTGIPASGQAPAGASLALLPADSRHAVRAVQTYKQDAEAAIAGACAAINLRDLEPEAVARGMVLAWPGVYQATSGSIAHIRNQHASLPLKRLAKVKFHIGTTVVNASAKLIDRDVLKSGEEGFVHIRFEQPVVMAAGDRYILRLLNPVTTLGGGRILAVRDHKLKRSHPLLASRLAAALAAARQGDFFGSELMAGPEAVLPHAECLRLTQSTGAVAQAVVQARTEDGSLVDLGGEGRLVAARQEEFVSHFRQLVDRYHRAHPYQWGMDPTLACREAGLPAAAFKALCRSLTAKRDLVVRNGRLALADFAPALSPQQMKWREAIADAVRAAGVNAPARGNLAKDLGIPEKDMRLLLRLLGEEGLIAMLGPNIIDAGLLADCRGKLADFLAARDVATIADFRRITGASRNLAVAMLDEFDAQGLTRRVGEGRVLATELG